jgi:putative membrane protein insertion efficiency factor
MSAGEPGSGAAPRRGPGVAVASGAIRAYQVARAGRPSPCRFDPSCSAYALEAVQTHGALRGCWLALRRLLRCHPWGGRGYDPVPARKHHSQVVGAAK